MYTNSAWSVGQMPTCGFWDSKDLINWSNQRLATLSSDPKIMAWGPEAIFDSANGNYIVLWSTQKSNSIWYNTTNDFKTFSKEAEFFNPGYQVLENNIYQYGGYYYLFYKDERGENNPNTSYKALKAARSTSLNAGSFTELTEDYISPHLSEGPVIVKALDEERWYLYYDMFMDGGIFKVSTTTDLNSGTSGWVNLPDDQFSLPKRVRNAHIFEIDEHELSRLKIVWDNGPNFAQGKTVTASSNQKDFPASNANDTNYNSWWSADTGKGADEWLEINLEQPQEINKIIIRQTHVNLVTSFKLQYFSGYAWNDIFAGDTLGTNVRVITFDPITSTRIRLLITAVKSDSGNQVPRINELEIYNSSTGNFPVHNQK